MSLLTRCYKLTIGFFKEEKKTIAILGIISLIIFELFTVFLIVRFNQWYAEFYNSLQDLNKEKFKQQLLFFTILAAIYISNALLKIALKMWYSMEWRSWMTSKYLNLWLVNHNYCVTKILGKEVDNPDQRISQDISEFATIMVSLFLGVLNAITTIISFIAILWSLSDLLEFNILGIEIKLHGYLVWVALLYSLLGTCCIHWLGKSLSELLFKQEKKEADFRYQMIRIRENAESIAIYNAIDFEKNGALGKFALIIKNTKNIIFRQMKITSFVSFYQQFALILPFIVLAPRYFIGKITLGVLMQIVDSFRRMEEALSWIISSYTDIANLSAIIGRLEGFGTSINFSDSLIQDKKLNFINNREGNVIFENLKIYLPDNKLLLSCDNLQLRKARYLITGISGSGKSTLLKTMRNLWPYAKGNISFPDNATAMFIPQKTYMPLGSLRSALSYPLIQYNNDNDIQRLLVLLGLQHLQDKLDEISEWSRILSLGEQQKLAFIRCILNKPDMVFLDEATSALDLLSEKAAYELLTKNLPDKLIVSIAHKNTLTAYHDVVITIKDKLLQIASSDV